MSEELKDLISLKTENRQPIYLDAYRKLRELITSGYFKKGEKLMSEAKLAEMMNIGRTSVRTALVLLYEDGYVITLQGKGTFVTKDFQDKKHNLSNCCMTIRSKLKQLGYRTKVDAERSKRINGDDFLDEKLQANGQNITMVNVIYSIDNDPAVISQMFCIEGLAGTLESLEDIFDSRVSYVTSSFAATTLKNVEYNSELFQDAKNILVVSSTWYDNDDKPICYCKDYLNNDVCRYTIRQNKEVR